MIAPPPPPPKKKTTNDHSCLAEIKPRTKKNIVSNLIVM